MSDDKFMQTLAIIADSQVPAELVRTAGNLTTSLAQAGVSNPLAAATASILTASAMRRAGVLDKLGKEIIYAGAAGYLGAEVATDVFGNIIGTVSPFGASDITQTSVAFDVPDRGGAPAGGAGALRALMDLPGVPPTPVEQIGSLAESTGQAAMGAGIGTGAAAAGVGLGAGAAAAGGATGYRALTQPRDSSGRFVRAAPRAPQAGRIAPTAYRDVPAGGGEDPRARRPPMGAS